jgi:hypothetical protein
MSLMWHRARRLAIIVTINGCVGFVLGALAIKLAPFTKFQSELQAWSRYELARDATRWSLLVAGSPYASDISVHYRRLLEDCAEDRSCTYPCRGRLRKEAFLLEAALNSQSLSKIVTQLTQECLEKQANCSSDAIADEVSASTRERREFQENFSKQQGEAGYK